MTPDLVRREDEQTAIRIENLLMAAYRLLGYNPVHVPLMSIESRADFVLRQATLYLPGKP